MKCAGTGRLGQLAGLADGPSPAWAPNLNVANVVYHELVRSDSGIIWASRGLEGDTANRWKRVNAVRVDDPAGTGDVFVPVRVFDSRTGVGRPVPPDRRTLFDVTWPARRHPRRHHRRLREPDRRGPDGDRRVQRRAGT